MKRPLVWEETRSRVYKTEKYVCLVDVDLCFTIMRAFSKWHWWAADLTQGGCERTLDGATARCQQVFEALR